MYTLLTTYSSKYINNHLTRLGNVLIHSYVKLYCITKITHWTFMEIQEN